MKTNQWSLAAIIASVSVLILQSTAPASVVHTAVNATVSGSGYIKIDLNHDGITDFLLHSNSSYISLCGRRGAFDKTMIKPTLGNGVVVSSSNQAAVLTRGIPINHNSDFYPLAAVVLNSHCESAHLIGFLGLEFQITGHTHYGWAKVIIDAGIDGAPLSTTLVDVAYETIAGQTINSGQTSSPNVDQSGGNTSAVPQSLGPGDSFWAPFFKMARATMTKVGQSPGKSRFGGSSRLLCFLPHQTVNSLFNRD